MAVGRCGSDHSAGRHYRCRCAAEHVGRDGLSLAPYGHVDEQSQRKILPDARLRPTDLGTVGGVRNDAHVLAMGQRSVCQHGPVFQHERLFDRSFSNR